MHQAHQLVVFTLDEQRYAVPLSAVERVVRMVEITTIPQTPEIVLGVINVQGQIIPVVDIRQRFRLAARAPHPSDQLVIARTSRRAVALVVDAVSEVVTLSGQEVVTGETILAHLDYLTGVVKRPDGLILIHDLDRFLSLEEARALHDAIDSMTP
jgi:purine-binding chemotaxis protein CheW